MNQSLQLLHVGHFTELFPIGGVLSYITDSLKPEALMGIKC